MDYEIHSLTKEANFGVLGTALKEGLKLGVKKPVNAIRSVSNKWLGVGSKAKMNQYADDVAANQKRWNDLSKQQTGAGQASRFLQGANKVRQHGAVQWGVPIAGTLAQATGVNVPGLDAAMWVTNPFFSAANAGVTAVQGYRAGSQHWRDKIQQHAQAGVRQAGSEAMNLINNGVTSGQQYNQMLGNAANQNGMGDWMRRLNNPRAQEETSSTFRNIMNGNANGLVQDSISREILKAQRGGY